MADVLREGPRDRGSEDWREPRAHLHLRSLSPPTGLHGAQTGLIESLRELADDGPLEDLAVSTWGNRLCRCETCLGTDPGAQTDERLADYREWAARASGTVELPFESTTIRSEFTGETHEAIVPPQVGLAVSDGGRLRGVFPCEVDGRLFTVEAAVGALESVLTDRRSMPVDTSP